MLEKPNDVATRQEQQISNSLNRGEYWHRPTGAIPVSTNTNPKTERERGRKSRNLARRPWKVENHPMACTISKLVGIPGRPGTRQNRLA